MTDNEDRSWGDALDTLKTGKPGRGTEMDKDLMHLAKITMDNLPKGKATFTESEIIDAMQMAVSKEESMTMQLLKSSSFYGKPEVIACFKQVMADMVYESVNA